MYHHIHVDRRAPSRTDVYLYESRAESVPVLRVRYGTSGARAPLVAIAAAEEPATPAFITGESLRLEPLTARALVQVLALGALDETLTIATGEADVPVTLAPHDDRVLLTARNFEAVLCENAPEDIARVAKALEIALAHAAGDWR